MDGNFVSGSAARYDPFGAFTTPPTTNPSISNHGFTGHRHNNTGANDLGLIYMNARYYLPEVGRFISADTIVPEPENPQSYNRYSYSYNRPINFSDATGHCAVDANGNILLDKNDDIAKTECAVDDFQTLTWAQRQEWLRLFIEQHGLGDWFIDIARVIEVFANDPDYSDMSGWAAYADAAVLQAINDGMRLQSGQQAIGAQGGHGGSAWAAFFAAVIQAQSSPAPGPVAESELIVLRLKGEQGGVDYATGLVETQRRFDALSSRVRFKSQFFLTGANAYRSAGIRCHAGCSSPLSGAGALIESLVVAHTDPRTSGDTWLIQVLAQAPDIVSDHLFPGSP